MSIITRNSNTLTTTSFVTMPQSLKERALDNLLGTAFLSSPKETLPTMYVEGKKAPETSVFEVMDDASEIHPEDEYMHSREGCYEYRSVRYAAAAQAMASSKHGLDNDDTVVDLGAGWTEMDYYLRRDMDWRGRYLPMDYSMTGVDLETWTPPRSFEWFVALEIAEHLHDPARFLSALQDAATHGVVVSVPDPRTVDVLAIDDTHVTTPGVELLESLGFTVFSKKFYGGVYSQGKNDALLGVWIKE